MPAVGGGTIRGVIKSGPTPLPGVTITATNTLTGKKYATTTDITGSYTLNIPQNGRYVLRTDFAGFAATTKEALLNATNHAQQADFTLELASRAAQEENREQQTARQFGGSGAQSLALMGAAAGLIQAGAGGESGTQMPSIAGNSDFSNESVAVTGQTGYTSPLAGMGDQIRQGFENEQQMRSLSEVPGQSQQGGGNGFFIAGPGGGGFGGGPGGGGGPMIIGGGRGGRGFGNFRNFRADQPHGALFWTGGDSALNAKPFALRGQPIEQPSYNSNRFGATLVGEPFIPHLMKPRSNDFIFLTLSGQRTTSPFNQYGTVPTALERTGNFSDLSNAQGQLIRIYNPATGQPFPDNTINTPLSPEALALLNYYPAPNLPGTTNNFRFTTIEGTNTTVFGARWNHTFGSNNTGMPAIARQFVNSGSGWNQSIYFNFNLSHSASDQITLFPELGGKQQTHSYSLTAGYTLGKGKLTNNFSLSWNHNNSELRNYFTNTTDVATQAGILGPNGLPLNSDPLNYGVPNLVLNQFNGLNETQPNYRLTETYAFSDMSMWRHGKHNLRFGGDIRRVHLDLIGGTNSTGTFYFTGLFTEAPGTATTSTGSTGVAASGSSFADFLLGLPQETAIQSPNQKAYMRANIWDLFLQDDWRVLPNLTLLGGLRYEYFSPYSEKNDHLATLDYNAGFTSVVPVYPDGVGPYSGKYTNSLLEPDRNNFSPRIGIAWRPIRETVVRGGYGINYTAGQYATFIQNLAYQPPFANVQTNEVTSGAQITMANGFPAPQTIGNYTVNKNYRLPYVQVWNLDIQRTLPLNIVLNVGYNGAKGTRLDILDAPGRYNNVSASGVLFNFEDSVAFSNFNALVVRANKRLQNGVALQATYTYSHSIDNASSIGAGSAVVAQNWQDLLAEESNSSFDIRHQVKGSFLYELPFGPDKHYLSTGNWMSHAFGDWSLSGTYSITSGEPLTPSISASVEDVARGTAGSLRPNRTPGVSITSGGGKIDRWFNTDAFSPTFAPGQFYGTASRYSIPGPGTIGLNMSLSKTFQFKETRSFEIRATADNAFNIVQYAGVNTQFDSPAVGQVTSAGTMRQFTLLARYRF